MTPQNFTYWLQGFFELSDELNELNDRQLQIIKDHLALVFKKETPNRIEGPNEIEYCQSDDEPICSDFPLDIIHQPLCSSADIPENPCFATCSLSMDEPIMGSS